MIGHNRANDTLAFNNIVIGTMVKEGDQWIARNTGGDELSRSRAYMNALERVGLNICTLQAGRILTGAQAQYQDATSATLARFNALVEIKNSQRAHDAIFKRAA